jgi:hypothetical protein
VSCQSGRFDAPTHLAARPLPPRSGVCLGIQGDGGVVESLRHLRVLQPDQPTG